MELRENVQRTQIPETGGVKNRCSVSCTVSAGSIQLHVCFMYPELFQLQYLLPLAHKHYLCTVGTPHAPQLATCQHNPYDTHVYKEDFLWGPLLHTPPGKYST
jgi:hypothetical protein